MKKTFRRARTQDGLQTFDRQTIDSTGAFLIGELERLDPKMHAPLVNYTWSRDIDLREDVTMADETSSFTNSTFAAAGGVGGPKSNSAYGNYGGKAWVGKDTNAIQSMQLDIGKTANPLSLWAMELGYTIPELESAQKLGRPIDVQKLTGIQLKHQMDIDEQVYIGDADLGFTGLINNAGVTANTVVQDSSSHTTWALKISDDSTGNVGSKQILADVNTLLNQVWSSSGFAACPTVLGVPPAQFALLTSTLISSAGNQSIMTFLRNNSISLEQNGTPLIIRSMKWLKGAGSSGTDRMIAYTKRQDFVRFPMVPMQRTPLEYRSIYHLTTYYCRLGVVEFVYPETVGYADGI